LIKGTKVDEEDQKFINGIQHLLFSCRRRGRVMRCPVVLQ